MRVACSPRWGRSVINEGGRAIWPGGSQSFATTGTYKRGRCCRRGGPVVEVAGETSVRCTNCCCLPTPSVAATRAIGGVAARPTVGYVAGVVAAVPLGGSCHLGARVSQTGVDFQRVLLLSRAQTLHGFVVQRVVQRWVRVLPQSGRCSIKKSGRLAPLGIGRVGPIPQKRSPSEEA